jgi:hypothetical protein
MTARSSRALTSALRGVAGGKPAKAKPKGEAPKPQAEAERPEMKYTVLLTEAEARSLEDEVFRRRTNKLKAANRSAIIREAISAYLK